MVGIEREKDKNKKNYKEGTYSFVFFMLLYAFCTNKKCIYRETKKSKEQKQNSIKKREQSERVNNKELNLRSKRQQRLTE